MLSIGVSFILHFSQGYGRIGPEKQARAGPDGRTAGDRTRGTTTDTILSSIPWIQQNDGCITTYQDRSLCTNLGKHSRRPSRDSKHFTWNGSPSTRMSKPDCSRFRERWRLGRFPPDVLPSPVLRHIHEGCCALRRPPLMSWRGSGLRPLRIEDQGLRSNAEREALSLAGNCTSKPAILRSSITLDLHGSGSLEI